MAPAQKTAWINARVLTPWESLDAATIVVEGERIVDVRQGAWTADADTTVLDLQNRLVLPGLIDTHVHGSAGHDVMDATPAALAGMARFFASRGVTSFLPTTMTASREATLAAIENVTAYQKAQQLGAYVLGIHLEGPYVNAGQPGVQPVEHIRPADPEEYTQFFAHGNVRLITVAPEIPKNHAVIRYAIEHGAAVSAGHTEATYEQMLEAVAMGVNQATHTFNAMIGIHHRKPGTAGATLTCDDLFAQAIVDLIHLHPAIVKLLVRAKGAARTVLVTDAMRATSLPDGEYDIGGTPVTVRNGIATLTGGTALAGSTLTMDRALANVMAASGLSLAEALPMATAVPAASIGLGHEVGAIRPGYSADLIVVDGDLQVQLTMVHGKIVYDANDPDGRS